MFFDSLDSYKGEKLHLFLTFAHCSFKNTSYNYLESKKTGRVVLLHDID